MKLYNKLVRDKIPEIIKADGEKPITRKLSNIEYLDELVKKLREEIGEFEANHSLEELADVQEIVLAIIDALKIQRKDLEKARKQKAKARGGFSKRIFLEKVDD